MDFSKENITLIITGLPSVGKSTLALSAPNPVIIDADKGLVRVKPEHRKTAVVFKNYEEILEDIEKMKGVYETVIIDTGGALIDAIKDWAARNN
jgi:AAA+ ATPase superfamily predicted ATPase